MSKSVVRRLGLPALLLATGLLGGCYYPPGYYGGYGYPGYYAGYGYGYGYDYPAYVGTGLVVGGWGWRGGWGCCGWGYGFGWGLWSPFWDWPPYWYNPWLDYGYPPLEDVYASPY